MYKPEDRKNPQYPVFARLNGRVVPWLSVKCFAATAVAALLAVFLWSALGDVSREVMEPLSKEQAQARLEELSTERSLVELDEATTALAQYLGPDGNLRDGLGEEQASKAHDLQETVGELESATFLISEEEADELRSAASEDGVTAGMTDEDLRSLVPSEAPRMVPLVGEDTRFAMAILIVSCALFFTAEWFDGPSLVYLIRQRLAYNRQQHSYRYRKINDFGREWEW